MTRNQLAGLFGLSNEPISHMLALKGFLTKQTLRSRKIYRLTPKGLKIGKDSNELGTFVLNARAVQKVLDLHLVNNAEGVQ